MDNLKGLVIIPCYNESGSVAAVLKSLEGIAEVDTLVVDDGSSDSTYISAKSATYRVRHPFNLGIGATVQTGLMLANELGYDFAMQLDGDGQHPSSEIPKFIQEFKKSQYDLIIGSRFLGESTFLSTKLRQMGISIIRKEIKALSGQKVTDPTSGFRLMSKRAIEVFSYDYPSDYPEPSSVIIANNHGLKIREISVKMKAREHGKSSLDGLKGAHYMMEICFRLFLLLLRGKKR